MDKKPVIIMVAVVIFAFIPTSVTVPYQKLENYQEEYTDKEAYQVQVPYTDTEYYTEKEPYAVTYTEQEPFTDTRNVQKDLVYNIANTVCSQKVDPGVFSSGQPAQVTYRVNNLDTEGGSFNFWV